jgi:hypothetical protein
MHVFRVLQMHIITHAETDKDYLPSILLLRI